MATPKPILISIEGDIGAGKSTLIQYLKERNPTWNFIDEPVGTWTSLKTDEGENLLELFYKDQKRYSYTFQNCALLSRAMNIQNTIETWQKNCMVNPALAAHNVFITERCLETDYFVFAKMLRDDGKMNKMEWDLYQMWYTYVKGLSTPPTGIIYVATPPEICAERIMGRGRKGEEEIPLSYLTNLDLYQKEWLYNSERNLPLMKYINYGVGQTPTHTVEGFIKYLETI
jgi:deoxyadenosine/deoxycytidine kinase